MSRRGIIRVRRDFAPLWRIGLMASAAVVVVCLGSLLFRGLNLGIDFEGGGIWEAPAGDASVSDVREALRPLGRDDATIQEATDANGERRVQVRSREAEVTDSEDIVRAIAAVTGSTFDDVDTTTVGPSWGDEITRSARNALIFFFVAVALYIALRLEWRMAIAALAAVVHDIVVTVGAYSVFGFEVTPATVIAFLTILGYSLYDTVVVFDRVRENEARLAGSKASYKALVNVSMNQVITRSINTTITSVLPVLSLLIIGSFILGATTLREFGIALLIGLLAGTYSSLFIATPVLVWLKEREEKWAKLKERAERLGEQDDAEELVAAADRPRRRKSGSKTSGAGSSGDAESGVKLADADADADSSAGDSTASKRKAAGSGAVTIESDVRSHPPRPRKQKRRK
jgi:preprotein translocase subunit SecF